MERRDREASDRGPLSGNEFTSIGVEPRRNVEVEE